MTSILRNVRFVLQICFFNFSVLHSTTEVMLLIIFGEYYKQKVRVHYCVSVLSVPPCCCRCIFKMKYRAVVPIRQVSGALSHIVNQCLPPCHVAVGL